MSTAITCPPIILQFFDNAGNPNVGGYISTQVGGIDYPTYEDSAMVTPLPNPIPLNSRGEISNAAGASKQLYLDPSAIYVFTMYDVNGNQLNQASTVGGLSVTGLQIAALLNTITTVPILASLDRSAIEIAAGVTPVDYTYPVLTPPRYASIADWALVYAQVDTLAKSYDGWYRGDHAQHNQLTNAIVGFMSYDDSQMTGTLGYRCTAFGALTLLRNNESVAAGGSNTAIGYASQQDSVDTSGNTSVGTKTLASCTGVSSSHNAAFGNSTLEALVSGTQNNAFSYRCMYQLVRGNNNTGMGDVVLQGLIAGDANTCYGAQAGFTKPGGNYLHAFGYQACFHETSALISGISKAATCVVTISTVSGANPYAVNDYVTFNDVSGMTEINDLSGIVTAIGGSSGAWTVSVAIDSTGFTTYTSGGYLSPYGNCAFGYKTQFENTYASGNTTFGTETASTSALGIANTLIGFQAGRVINGGSFNTVSGWRAGLALSTSASNTLYGTFAGAAITTGGSNVMVGDNTGASVTTGTKNTHVGSGTGSGGNWNNTSCLGYNAIPNGDNTVNLGDTNIVQIRAQVTSITAYSDVRLKKNVATLDIPDGFLEELRTVSFQWDADKFPDGVSDAMQVGVIAQEIDALQTKYGVEWLGLVDKSNPERWEATPGKLLFPLITYAQKQAKRMASIEARLAALEGDDLWRKALL